MKSGAKTGYRRKPVVLFSTCLNEYHWQQSIPHYLQFLNTFKISSNQWQTADGHWSASGPYRFTPRVKAPVRTDGHQERSDSRSEQSTPFLPGIGPRFLGRPARSLVTNSTPSHATAQNKVPLRFLAPCLGKETQGESLRVYDPIGGRRGRYRAGRWETIDLSFCVLRVLGPQGRTLESEGTEGRYCMWPVRTVGLLSAGQLSTDVVKENNYNLWWGKPRYTNRRLDPEFSYQTKHFFGRPSERHFKTDPNII
jgi:hypothetical protein